MTPCLSARLLRAGTAAAPLARGPSLLPRILLFHLTSLRLPSRNMLFVTCPDWLLVLLLCCCVIDWPPGEPPVPVLLDGALASQPEESVQGHRRPVARGFGGQRCAQMGQRQQKGRGKQISSSVFLYILNQSIETTIPFL